MVKPNAIGVFSRCSVVGLGVSLCVLTVLSFAVGTGDWPRELTKLVVPFFLSLGVITLGVGLLRGETSDSRILVVGASGVGGMVLLGIVSSFTLATLRIEGGSIPSYRYLLLSNVTIGAAVGAVLGLYRVRLHQRTDQLADEVNRLDEFAGIVAHDLRNPLHIARGYLEELSREERETELEKIEAAHDRMERLIDHVLALSRRGNAVGETKTVEIGAVARVAWNDVPTSDEELRAASNASVEADERRLRSLFENLFRNAVEHGGDVSVVTVGSLESGFYVADDGQGIRPDRREQVFEGGFSSDGGGTGLGLAIVRQITDAHGWTVAVVESENGGARFDFHT